MVRALATPYVTSTMISEGVMNHVPDEDLTDARVQCFQSAIVWNYNIHVIGVRVIESLRVVANRNTPVPVPRAFRCISHQCSAHRAKFLAIRPLSVLET